MKGKEIAIYISLITIILFFFMIPIFVTKIEDKRMFLGNYVTDKKIQTQKPIAEKNDLIATIYSKYNNSEKYGVKVSDTNQTIKEIISIQNNVFTVSDPQKVLNKVEELVKVNILDINFFHDLMQAETIINRTWDYDNGDISYSKIKFFTSEDSFGEAIASIEVENTTNRIIAFSLKKEYLKGDDMLQQFVKYLGLDHYQDWIDINHELKSKEASIKITCVEENENLYVKAVPLDHI